MTISKVSSVDGSPRLERQVHKVTVQMHNQCPTFTAAGYFTIGRQMILKVKQANNVKPHFKESIFLLADNWIGRGFYLFHGQV